jgi:thiol-disulfide isomerase/thioredoxin
MSLFSRTSGEVDSARKLANELSDSSTPVSDRKEMLAALMIKMSSINATVSKFVTNADAGEADPNKRLYGATMVTKIRALKVTVDELNETVANLKRTVDAEWDAFVAEKEKSEREMAERETRRKELEHQRRLEEEEERKRKAEAQRMEHEKKLEEDRINAEKLANQRAEKEREEAAKAHAAIMEAEEAARRKREEEAAAAQVAQSEQDRRVKDAAASTMSLTVKTSKGISMAVNNVAANATVLDLKHVVEQSHNISASFQRLIFQGRLLDNDTKITDYGILNGAVVHLVDNSRAAASSNAPSPQPKPRVPPGTLCHLTNGRAEFADILASCGAERLAVFDFSAPWCGPCRMIAPVYERLAGRFADVTFVKVDTEQTPPNTLLAQELAISAYPTFQYYVSGRKVHEVSGANASQIEAGIRQFKPVPSSVRSSTISQGLSGASSTVGLTSRVMAALNSLKRNCTGDDFVVAVRTLLVFVRNITDHPSDPKYRRVRTANSAYQSRIARHGAHGVACMRAFGFEARTEDGDDYLILSEAAANNPELRVVKLQLETAMQAAGVAPDSGGLATATSTATPNAAGAAGGMAANPWAGAIQGGLPPMPSMDPALLQELMTDPALQQMAQEFSTNPEFMSLTMRLQAAMQSGDHAAMMQIASDPAMTRLQQVMMSNPRLFQIMTQQMGGGVGGPPGLAQMMGTMGAPGMGGAGARDIGGGPQGAGMGAGFATPTQPIRTTLDPPGAPRHGPAPDPPLPANVPFPGAPTTAEEEERLLQEAIRLSMEESSKQSSKNGPDSRPPHDDSGSGGSS